MSPFHFCLSAARNLSSFQLLHASLITDLLQLFFGLPLFLFPWGFQSRTAVGTSPSPFLNVWPIHLNFLFLISKFISSCPVTFHRSLLEIIFGHHILSICFGLVVSIKVTDEVPFHAWRSGGLSPLIFNLNTRLEVSGKLHAPQHALSRMVD